MPVGQPAHGSARRTGGQGGGRPGRGRVVSALLYIYITRSEYNDVRFVLPVETEKKTSPLHSGLLRTDEDVNRARFSYVQYCFFLDIREIRRIATCCRK